MDGAIARSLAAFPAWSDRDAIGRSAILIRAAAEMRDRRDELAGLMVREAGKTWREADADICEAIDFCEYYARMAVQLFRPRRLGRFVGELDEGLVSAARRGRRDRALEFSFGNLYGHDGRRAGDRQHGDRQALPANAGDCPGAVEILWRAGVPAEALQFLPGPGPRGWPTLVRSPHVSLIAFTGSKEVGLDILRAAGQTTDEQGFVKKVVCEMGGKNAIVVDESADLDEAVLGVRQSAFGYTARSARRAVASWWSMRCTRSSSGGWLRPRGAWWSATPCTRAATSVR